MLRLYALAFRISPCHAPPCRASRVKTKNKEQKRHQQSTSKYTAVSPAPSRMTGRARYIHLHRHACTPTVVARIVVRRRASASNHDFVTKRPGCSGLLHAESMYPSCAWPPSRPSPSTPGTVPSPPTFFAVNGTISTPPPRPGSVPTQSRPLPRCTQNGPVVRGTEPSHQSWTQSDTLRSCTTDSDPVRLL